MRPDDVRQSLLWHREDRADGFTASAIVNPGRNWPPCRVYWGSHGCSRPVGHEGAHWCDCCQCDDHPDGEWCVAGPPYYGPDTHFWGEDT